MELENYTPGYVSPIRWLPVQNTDTQPVPPYGVMAIIGVTTPADGSMGLFQVARPNAPSQSNVLLNGPAPIAPGAMGQGHMTYPGIVAYDAGTGVVPSSGDSLGTQTGSWLLADGNTGFLAAGAGQSGVVNAVATPTSLPRTSGCMVALDGTITNGTAITWDHVLWDTDGYAAGFPSTHIRLPFNGYYLVAANVNWFVQLPATVIAGGLQLVGNLLIAAGWATAAQPGTMPDAVAMQTVLANNTNYNISYTAGGAGGTSWGLMATLNLSFVMYAAGRDAVAAISLSVSASGPSSGFPVPGPPLVGRNTLIDAQWNFPGESPVSMSVTYLGNAPTLPPAPSVSGSGESWWSGGGESGPVPAGSGQDSASWWGVFSYEG